MVTGHHRGHPIYWDAERQTWLYQDDSTPAEVDRPCVKCDLMPILEGYDACLGHIPGASSACCGHGVEEGYMVVNGQKRHLPLFRWDWAMDRAAFWLMDLAAILSWFTWTTEKWQWIPALHVHDGITIFAGTYLDEYPRERWCYCEAMHWGAHDGWRPLRYEGRQAI